MKILGIAERSYPHGKSYICEITQGELAKVINKAGYREADKELATIKVGDDYPIAEGYDFREAIVEATRTMDAAYKSFQKTAPVMAKFASLIANTEESA
jgi:hypothetical protein